MAFDCSENAETAILARQPSPVKLFPDKNIYRCIGRHTICGHTDAQQIERFYCLDRIRL